MIVHKDFRDLLVGVVESSLLGSEYGLEAWKLLKPYILSGEEIPLSTLEELEELTDSALDDIEGPQLRVDLGREKLYG